MNIRYFFVGWQEDLPVKYKWMVSVAVASDDDAKSGLVEAEEVIDR